jgi:O-antigen/teichoic acid export membrane protein
MSEEAPAADLSPAADTAHASDLAQAARNTVKLGGSLIATWTVAFIVRFQLPRYLGPERFGDFNFTDNFAGAFFTVLELGIDTYIIRECAVRPKHANDFFGAILALRLVLGMFLFGAMATTLALKHRSIEIQGAVAVFGITYFIATLNNSLGALLQAAGTVGRLAISNVASKFLWGAGLAVAIVFKGSLPYLAAPLLVSELLKTSVLIPAARKALGLRFEMHTAMAKKVFLAAMPFFVNGWAVNLGGKLTVSMLDFITNDSSEVGWFGATLNLGGLALLLTPLIGWILLPLLARAKARSDTEAFTIIQRTIEGLIVTIVPVTLMLSLGATVLVRIAFGAKFDPAAMSLAVFSPSMMLMYLAMALSILLMTFDRSWTVTLISAGSIPVRAVLVLVLVPLCARSFGPGGAATGAAGAEMLTGVYAVTASGIAIGRRAVDRRALVALAKSIACVIAVCILDRVLHRFTWLRLTADTIAYVVLALAIRVVRIRDVIDAIKVIRTRKEPAAPVAT